MIKSNKKLKILNFLWIAVFLTTTFHSFLTIYNVNPATVFSKKPIGWFDHFTHLHQAVYFNASMRQAGKFWSYNPRFLAGLPECVIFDSDNKAIEIFVYLTGLAGTPPVTSFNIFILIASLIHPAFIFAAGRKFGLDKRSSLLASFFAILLWNFDSFTRRMWWGGMTCYLMAVAVSPLISAHLLNFASKPTIHRYISLALILSAGFLLHPYIVFIITPSIIVIYIIKRKSPLKTFHIPVWLIPVIVIIANLFWLLPLFEFRNYITTLNVQSLGGGGFLIADITGAIQPGTQAQLLGTKNFTRLLLWSLGAGGIIAFKKNGKNILFYLFLTSALWLFTIGYFGKYTWLTRQIQPLRHIVPLTFFMIIPASYLIETTLKQTKWNEVTFGLKAIVLSAFIVCIISITKDAVYFFPHSTYEIRNIGFGPPPTSNNQDKRQSFTLKPPPDDFEEIKYWVTTHNDKKSRFLVEWWPLGEYLSTVTTAHIIGGFRLINIKHGYANIFRKYFYTDPPENYFRRYLEKYGIRYIIFSGQKRKVESHASLLRKVHFIKPSHRIYESRINASLIDNLSPEEYEIKTTVNKIEVRGVKHSQLILKFHYLPHLRCRPSCEITRQKIEDDPVGFIKVKKQTKNFIIENTY